MPSRDDILKAFDRINVWSRGSERAPHKPLLVLYALGQLSRGDPNSIAFRDVAPKLTELLKEFGPTRQSYHPEYPFWRLQNDGVWVVDDADRLQRRTGQTDIPKRELLDKSANSELADQATELAEPIRTGQRKGVWKRLFNFSRIVISFATGNRRNRSQAGFAVSGQ